MTPAQEKEIREFNSHMRWIRGGGLNQMPKAREWGSYEDAKKILDMCPDWYRIQRKVKMTLIEGVDWRSINGKKIEYRLASVERLKHELVKQ